MSASRLKFASLTLIVLCGVSAASHAAALQVVSPVACGTASGSAYQYAPRAIDDQPTWDAGTSQPVGVWSDGYSSCMYNGGATGYFDFGEDWQNIRIAQTWTRYRAYTNETYVVPELTMWWDDDTDTVNDGVAETVLDFGQHTFTASVGNNWLWFQDVDTSAAPVSPAGRYLLITTPEDVTGQMNEFAWIGYVPEPVSMVLLAVGGVAILRRRF